MSEMPAPDEAREIPEPTEARAAKKRGGALQIFRNILLLLLLCVVMVGAGLAARLATASTPSSTASSADESRFARQGEAIKAGPLMSLRRNFLLLHPIKRTSDAF